ncbi:MULTISPECIES: Gx transporter family protein [Calditerrivibrio]
MRKIDMMAYPDNTKIISILASISIVLGFLENLFPLPIPFIRLGISNIPIVIGVYLIKELRFLLLLGGIKSLITAIFSTGFIFRLIIAFPSILVAILFMFYYHKATKNYSSAISTSVIGSVVNITMQFIIIKLVIIKHLAFLKILPYFILAAILTGAIVGLISNNILNKRG